ncbi:MAG: DUF1461 domain-containing protein [Candidatus Babeliales bacterium]|nr:DUF1461 domain-containing protein [Candidatus Babeliales bacterium]
MIKFIKIFLSIIISYSIFYISLYSIAFYNINFYKTEFQKHGIYNKFPNHDINKINNNVLNYLKNSEHELIKNFFNKREIEHLRDVKDLFSAFTKIFKILLIIFIILSFLLFFYSQSFKIFVIKILSSLIYGSIISISIICALGLLIFFDFDSIFIQMHNVFFKPDTWIFNFDDNIVNLYVEDFFYNIAICLVKTILIISSSIAVTSIIIRKILTNRSKI